MSNNFETDMKELEGLVAKLEQGDLTLDGMLDLFEKGVTLSKQCAKTLDQAEARIKIITQKDGETVKQDFQPVNQGESR